MKYFFRAFGAALILFLSQGVAFADIDRAYCLAGDYSSVCSGLDLADPSQKQQCDARQEQEKSDCEAYLDSWASNWEALSGFLAKLFSEHLEFIFAAIAALFAAAAAYFRNRFEELRKRLFDPFIKRLPEYKTIGANVLLVGIGGVGKTSIIRALCGSTSINPAAATASNKLYSIAHEFDMKERDVTQRRLFRVFISDHVGQNFGTVPETPFYKEMKFADLPKCLVFVVDLFPVDDGHGENNLYDTFDEDRVAEHLSVYHKELVSVITNGLPAGSMIILFINKLDKLKNISPDQISKAKELFSPLIDLLGSIRGAELRVLVGSAATGQSIAGCEVVAGNVTHPSLYQALVDVAVSVNG